MKPQDANDRNTNSDGVIAEVFCDFLSHVPLYVRCQLNEGDSERFEHHVIACARCRDAVAAAIESGLAPDWLDACRDSELFRLGEGSPKLSAIQTVTNTIRSLDETQRLDDSLVPADSERYRIERRIGEGGMGVVWEGSDTVMRRRVALKSLKSTGKLNVMAPRLLQEAASLARLSHPSIVRVFEVFNEDSQPTLVMEFVDGPTLCRWRRGKIINERQSAKLIEQLAYAVQHAHENGVVHRDLKPSNILLSAPKEWSIESSELEGVVPKLSDFGLARIMGEEYLTQTGEMLGTPAYMAPEQALGITTAIGPAADIYGLGAVLYDLLTGTPPHMAQDPVTTLVLVREREPVAPRLLRPELSKDIETICLKCLRKSAGDRYLSAGDLAADLRAYLEGRVIKARPVGAVATVLRWCRRHKLLTLAFSISSLSILAMILGALQFARTERRLRERADEAVARANKSEADAKAEATRADQMRSLIKSNYDVSMNAVSNLVDASGLSGEVIDLDSFRALTIREGFNVYKSFVDSLPEPEHWSLADAIAVTRFLEFAHRQTEPIDGRPWLDKLATIVDRLETENSENPKRYVVRQKHAREMAILAQIAGKNDDAALWWEKAAKIQQSLVALDPQNPTMYYSLSQASMNAALYHSYCGRTAHATTLAETSVAAYRKIFDFGNSDRHQANFVEKLFWQARFERENGNQDRYEAARAEALERSLQFPVGSAYYARLEKSRSEIIGN